MDRLETIEHHGVEVQNFRKILNSKLQNDRIEDEDENEEETKCKNKV